MKGLLLLAIACVVRANEFDELSKDAKIDLLTAQVEALNRRLLERQLQDEEVNRRRLKVTLNNRVGLKIRQDTAYVSLGKKQDVVLYRNGDGALAADAKTFTVAGSTQLNGPLTVASELTAKNKVSFVVGKKKCSLEIKGGKLSTDCELETATTRKLSAKLAGLKTCDEEKIMKLLQPKLDLIIKQTKANPKPESCADVLKYNPNAKSGMYDLFPGGKKINLKCEMTKNGGGWTRFLQLNGSSKSGCGNFKDVPLNREIVGPYCKEKEFTFSRSMMLKSKHQLMFTDDQNRIMWYRFDNCAKNSCTCDKASDKGLCFFLAVTADYSGGRPLIKDAGQDFDIWTEAYDWGQKRWENAGDGQCGGSNANAHTQFNCEPVREKNLGQCGQRWHYGVRHDGSHKGGSTCGGGGAGCAWNWYTGLATSWRGGCNADKAAWMISGPKANNQKRTAEVWFR